ncbi:MAG: hypothetical protein KVP17_004827 [Porospora cf. gigantea B]|uniref:uncharacterized protein n=1 Tax=Porospora cf. gigantea B TaxID=2853592 RepID=UPI003571CEA3|nr:MAG: hypothetical protein KVP17_004827 [Porospora cf. gigantea B]
MAGQISLKFWAMLALFGIGLVSLLLVHSSLLLAAVVMLGWLVSLCLHEGGHAICAYYGGDWTMDDSGYLRLDITQYTDLTSSVIIPVTMLALGGVPLPGGAVMIHPDSLRNRRWKVLTALGGVIANLACAAALSIGFHTLSLVRSVTYAHLALALMIYHQVIAIAINILPLPTLDGWAALEPFIPESFLLKRILRNRWHARSVSLLVFLVIFTSMYYIPGFRKGTELMLLLFGIPADAIRSGAQLFQSGFGVTKLI